MFLRVGNGKKMGQVGRIFETGREGEHRWVHWREYIANGYIMGRLICKEPALEL